MYACCCTQCALAETSTLIGAAGPFGTRDCAAQCCAALALQLAIDCAASLVGLGGVFGPWVWTCYAARTRELMQARWALPKDEMCCDSTITTFLPYAVSCFPCAVYQQAYY